MSSAQSALRQRTNSSKPSEAAVGSGAIEELRSIFDPSTCVRKGLCPVTRIRHQEEPFESHSLYFEQHGTGLEKIIMIMG